MAAAAGRLHSAAVGEDGSLFVWGSGNYSRLGTGDTANRLAPTRVAGLPAPVRQVAAWGCHMGMVTEAGDLLMCGYGEYGQLGLGDEEDRTTPTRVARAVFDGEARRGEPLNGVARPELAVSAAAPHKEGAVLADGGAVEAPGCDSHPGGQ